MIVVCINDTRLPIGADVVKGKEYEVLEKFINSYDQITYIIEGATNDGKTKFGLPWRGYVSTRFAVVKPVEEKVQEHENALNQDDSE